MKNKLIAIQCLSLCDIALAIYTYFAFSNFNDFKAYLNQAQITSPDLQFQVYKLFLQTLTFTSIILVLFHLVIYYFFYKEKKFAKLYVKYYALLAAVSMIISVVFARQYILIVPGLIYSFGFYNALKFEPLESPRKKVKSKA